MSSEEESVDQTPPTCGLLGLLLKNRRPTGAVNEVWPDLFVGNAATARNKTLLQNLGITHVVNAADGPQHIDTGPRFYRDADIQYHGVEAADCRDFDLSPFFSETADFIHRALSQKGTIQSNRIRTEAWSYIVALAVYSSLTFCWTVNPHNSQILRSLQHFFSIHLPVSPTLLKKTTPPGKVLVHCARGISRSGTLVLAFLMIKEGLTLVEAVELVCRSRNILPNTGFLNQLCQLDSALRRRKM
ncbi:dual specificity protein phosphatase 13 isoform B-like isoform X1 [Poecilia latipinna]|uniref:dual specificity protein phosphatase 13-like isoform X1 n=1 Tax=Poecilia formosa TaxID=48698 RepID=UPI0004441DEB|nr:PREDICTED: dual specificity protein phosphatase 13-like isoform X1 [Poecilia formosa]XP_014891338.1 PREDICTED: dual specificity protein phosphatase 13 isoform B-like isoform X1 [Poecilia latipinna]XP_014891339.1 PREDICTED: dual specificity protein phosphatase 13 isoform B-like isoform X1 [Poecilia latipinna]XP_016529906.1 PREDICTED: dual specificity protein phosphatase 13-like isoform X1 [Poecilia formosa]XP_016529907.1 PREDICTED: dual specificity protein phosphatase 13-like isoform X1 [Poec